MINMRPKSVNQIRISLGYLENQLKMHNHHFLLQTRYPHAIDLYCASPIWAMKKHGARPDLLTEFPNVMKWFATLMEYVGPERPIDILESEDSLELASKYESLSSSELDKNNDELGLSIGDLITITPDDYGKIAVEGHLFSISKDMIAIKRRDNITGLETIIHFSRSGHDIKKYGQEDDKSIEMHSNDMESNFKYIS